jgi:hypothetical protein
MMRGKWALIVLLPLFSALAAVALGQAMTAEVKGSVFHHDNKPALNCTVAIDGHFNYVDGNGNFRIFKVPVGNQTLRVTCNRHLLKEETVTIHAPVDVVPKIVLPR